MFKKISAKLDGKKTFFGIGLAAVAMVVSFFAPGEISREELQALIDSGQETYTVTKESAWPAINAFIGLVIATIGRILAKPKA